MLPTTVSAIDFGGVRVWMPHVSTEAGLPWGLPEDLDARVHAQIVGAELERRSGKPGALNTVRDGPKRSREKRWCWACLLTRTQTLVQIL